MSLNTISGAQSSTYNGNNGKIRSGRQMVRAMTRAEQMAPDQLWSITAGLPEEMPSQHCHIYQYCQHCRI